MCSNSRFCTSQRDEYVRIRTVLVPRVCLPLFEIQYLNFQHGTYYKNTSNRNEKAEE